ncbi:hypothetical protein Forpi1262_v010958 [Fusarium oxysporum f. sp. raphani]|uniref:Uncharacterized protein n=1 Tax=Fusarium oxysporum f. sp. raphani TaxID=96318 RepID=A0A8J5U3P7_FUSOX|nr:hypothetical protein Forpi1262_v010958 [Fusarium oxysporum f. sp. raphani]
MEDDEARVTPLHQPASAAELNSIEKRDTALEKELHQQLSRHVSTSQHAQPSDQGPVIDTTSKKHPDQSNNSTQHVTKGKGQSGDTKTTAATEPLVEGQPKTGESTVKADQDESQSQGTSSKPEEHKVAAPQVSVGGSPAISGRPVTRLLLTQTTDWDAWPEESPQDSAHQEPDICEPRRKATVEDVPDSGDEVASESERALASETLDRGLAAKKRQEKRNKRSRKIQKDKAIVEESMTSDSRPQFLLTYPGEGLGSEPSNPTPETKEDKAHAREAERRHRREERELERDRRNMSRMNVVFLNRMDMYWFCQVDIYQGFWATPWKPDVPIQTSLRTSAWFTAIRTATGQLERDWITYGGISYPAYASNARGGVIARGSYKGVRVPAFQYTVPELELLYSYEWQVSSNLHDQERYCDELNIELMRIDAWLSYVGRIDKIANGPTDLLKGAPALVQLLQTDFEVDFINIDLSAKEGGHQDIQGLADNVMDFLTDEELDEAEQLYILVASLRAVKVCQCVLAGSNTREMEEILMKDVQAHLV